jgi:hypothetical protein
VGIARVPGNTNTAGNTNTESSSTSGGGRTKRKKVKGGAPKVGDLTVKCALAQPPLQMHCEITAKLRSCQAYGSLLQPSKRRRTESIGADGNEDTCRNCSDAGSLVCRSSSPSRTAAVTEGNVGQVGYDGEAGRNMVVCSWAGSNTVVVLVASCLRPPRRRNSHTPLEGVLVGS